MGTAGTVLAMAVLAMAVLAMAVLAMAVLAMAVLAMAVLATAVLATAVLATAVLACKGEYGVAGIVCVAPPPSAVICRRVYLYIHPGAYERRFAALISSWVYREAFLISQPLTTKLCTVPVSAIRVRAASVQLHYCVHNICRQCRQRRVGMKKWAEMPRELRLMPHGCCFPTGISSAAAQLLSTGPLVVPV